MWSLAPDDKSDESLDIPETEWYRVYVHAYFTGKEGFAIRVVPSSPGASKQLQETSHENESLRPFAQTWSLKSC